MVAINLTDSNDNKPIFQELSYNVTIPENHLGALPLSLNATDADAGNNGKVTYSIVPPSSLFSVDPVTVSLSENFTPW